MSFISLFISYFLWVPLGTTCGASRFSKLNSVDTPPHAYSGSINVRFMSAICTSSTAQGGGGSFKNRKPIGEVGCCESGMAERSHWWTERCLRSPLFLSLSLSLSLSFSLFLYLSIYLSIHLSIYVSTFLSFYLSILLPFYLSIYPSNLIWSYLILSYLILSI